MGRRYPQQLTLSSGSSHLPPLKPKKGKKTTPVKAKGSIKTRNRSPSPTSSVDSQAQMKDEKSTKKCERSPSPQPGGSKRRAASTMSPAAAEPAKIDPDGAETARLIRTAGESHPESERR